MAEATPAPETPTLNNAEHVVAYNDTNQSSAPIPKTQTLRHILRPLLLLAVLLLATVLRFNGWNWDQNTNLHPDERYVVWVSTAIKPPASLSEYFDPTQSTLNPFNTDIGQGFVYGTLPLFTGRYLADFFDSGCAPKRAAIPRWLGPMLFGEAARDCNAGFFTGWDYQKLVGRMMSALSDLVTIFALFFLGRKLFGYWAGLVAALLSALAVLQIQQAHFYTVDAMATTFVTLSLYFCARLVMHQIQTNKDAVLMWLNAAIAGLLTGLAVACKISAWPLAVIIVIAVGVALARDQRQKVSITLDALIAAVLAGVMAFAGLRLAQPYGFVGTSTTEYQLTVERCNGYDGLLKRVCDATQKLPVGVRGVVMPSARWLDRLTQAATVSAGVNDGPPGVQWANRTPVIFPLINIIFWGMGVPLGLAALVGFFCGVRQLLRGKRWYAHLILVLWAGGFFLYQGTQWVKSIRYQLPIYPVLCLFAALVIVRLATQHSRRVPSALFRLLAVGIVAGAAVWAVAFSSIYAEDYTRMAASKWMYAQVPSALTLQWDGGQKQTQLPVKDIALNLGSPFAFPLDVPTALSLNDDSSNRVPNADASSQTVSNLRLVLNRVQGEGGVRAKLMDAASNEVIEEVVAQLDAQNRTLVFKNATLQSDKGYLVELELISGAGLTARTSKIANEHWDDGMPVRWANRDGFGSYYNGLSTSSDGQIQNYMEDDPGKFDLLTAWLDEADYVVMSSNRLYGSMARQPWRYPMTNEYYRAMHAGELGFALVGDFNSYPRLGPITFNTQEMPYLLAKPANYAGKRDGFELPYPPAEEAFSVYDHPRVLVFAKTAAYSSVAVRRMLGKFDLTRTIKATPVEMKNAPNGMMMTPQTAAEQQSGGTWRTLFPRESILNQSALAAVFAWMALLQVLGLASFSLLALATSKLDIHKHGGITSSRLYPTLADAGYSFSKILGMVLVAFAAWWLGSLQWLRITPLVLWGLVLVLCAVGAHVAYHQRAVLLPVVRARWRIILVSELVFLLAFSAWLFVRAGNPDLWHPYMGGEKPMDFAYLNAVIRSEYFPPYDPWFSGGYINYYYFGFVVVGWLVKALGIDPAVAYNLIIPTLFALTAAGAFGIGSTLYAAVSQKETTTGGLDDEEKSSTLTPSPPHHLTFPISAKGVIATGVLAAIFAVGVGNLEQIRTIAPAMQKLGGIENGNSAVGSFISGVGKWLGGEDLPIYANHPYWNPTRPTEDIAGNPVMIAEFPQFTFLYADLHAHMMAMPMALLALAFAFAFAGGARKGYAVALAAVVVGALYPTNTWDYFPYLLLCVAGLLLPVANNKPITLGDALKAAVKMLPVAAILFVLTRAFFVPYYQTYGQAYNSVDVWEAEKTPLRTYITIYAMFALPLVWLAVLQLRQTFGNSNKSWSSQPVVWVLLMGVGTTLFLLTRNAPIAILAMPLLATCLAGAVCARANQMRMLWLAAAGAFALTIFVELFTLKGDIGRMNTVFKFYIVAWLLLAPAAAAAVVAVAKMLFRPQATDVQPSTVWQDRTQPNISKPVPAPRLAFAADAMLAMDPSTASETETQASEPSSIFIPQANLPDALPTPQLSLLSILRPVFIGIMTILFFLAALYPAFAIPAKIKDRYVNTLPSGLDGMAYMKQAVRYSGQEEYNGRTEEFPLSYDYEAIRWMQDNVNGSPVIVEEGSARGNQYRWSGRFAIYTGLPSVLGWQWHQRQQRASMDDRIVYDRDQDIDTLYSVPDVELAKLVLRRYNIKYIVLGHLERIYHDPIGLPKFDQLVASGNLRVAFQNTGTTIYEVIKD